MINNYKINKDFIKIINNNKYLHNSKEIIQIKHNYILKNLIIKFHNTNKFKNNLNVIIIEIIKFNSNLNIERFNSVKIINNNPSCRLFNNSKKIKHNTILIIIFNFHTILNNFKRIIIEILKISSNLN